MASGESEVIITFVHAILYGLYIASTAICLRWLVCDNQGWKLRSRISWLTVAITVVLFVFVTTNTAFTLLLTLMVVGNQVVPGYNVIYCVASFIGALTLIIVDAVLIFRCWVIYSKSWLIVILPLTFWTIDVVCCLIFNIMLSASPSGPTREKELAPSFARIYVIFYTFNIATNIYATSAIIIQIMRGARQSTGHTSGRLYAMTRIFAETGMLFTITSVLNLFLNSVAAKDARFQLASSVTDVINFVGAAITFNLLLIRVGQERRRSSEDSQKTTRPVVLSTFPMQVSTTVSSQDRPTITNEQLDCLDKGSSFGTRSDVEKYAEGGEV